MEAIIFDFDGVIIDSLGIKNEAFAHIYSSYGESVVEKVIDYHLNNGGISRYEKIKYCHKQFLNKNISEQELKLLVSDFSSFVMSKINTCRFVDGLMEFFEQNAGKYKMFISSGTPEYELLKIVEQKGIKKYFKSVHGSPKTKVEHIKQILDENFLFPNQVVFIGDAQKDKEAAQIYNLHFIARISSKDSKLKNQKYQIDDFNSIDEVLTQIDMSNLLA